MPRKNTIGFIGLGRMGLAMARRLHRRGHRIVGYAPSAETRRAAARSGIPTADSITALVRMLPSRRVLWLMVPSGKTVDQVLTQLLPLLKRGDVVVNGGNDFFGDSQRQAARLAKRGLVYLDCGTSGGVGGERVGYCLMVGGPAAAVRLLEPAFKDLAMPGGYAHFGPVGAGHFVKSVHNIIEYGYLQALGEGLQLLKDGPFMIDLKRASQVWQRGSVIRSWLVELAAIALSRPDFKTIKPIITSQTTGELTKTAGRAPTPLPVFRAAVKARKKTDRQSAFDRQVINAIRREFGHHRIVR